MDRLHLITVFVAVVDTSGFAGAARKLGISPPAVTRAERATLTTVVASWPNWQRPTTP